MYTADIKLDAQGRSTLRTYFLEPNISYQVKKARPLVIVCPGGGYVLHATKEQEPVALRFAGAGYHAAVLRYPVLFRTRPTSPDGNIDIDDAATFPAPLVALMQAMAWVRTHAQEYAIDASRVYVVGFSAGAHLAASLAEHWDDPELLSQVPGVDPRDCAPTGVMLGYPLVSPLDMATRAVDSFPKEIRWQIPYFQRALFGRSGDVAECGERLDLVSGVRPDMPRVFMWQTAEDQVVNPVRACQFAAALIDAGVPCEFHLFPTGPHGLALCEPASAAKAQDEDAYAAAWVPLALAWLRRDEPHRDQASL